MKLSRTLLAAALLSAGSAAHALLLDFTTLDSLRGSQTSFVDVSMTPYVFTVTGSVQSGDRRTFNNVVLGPYGFGIDSSFDEGSNKDLVNRYEFINFTFTTPAVVNLADVGFRKKDGKALSNGDEYEYRVDGGSWNDRDFNDSPDFSPALSGTSFEFRYEDESFYVASLDVSSPVAPIPEPETYALMLGGLGLVSFMARRRKAERRGQLA